MSAHNQFGHGRASRWTNCFAVRPCQRRYELMKIRALIFLAFFWSIHAGACLIDPSTRIIQNPDRATERSQVIFFGVLEKFIDLTEEKQIVEFYVLETYKGSEHNRVSVVSEISSSCGRVFFNKGSRYYVYANETEDNNVLVLSGSGSFVSEERAKKEDFQLEVRPHNQSSNSGAVGAGS